MFFRRLLLAAAASAVLGIGCGDQHDPLSSSVEPAQRVTTSAAVAGTCETPGCNPGFSQRAVTLTAQLGRSQVVPEIPASSGTGTFALNADSTELTYDIRVVGIPTVSNAHFHLGAAGSSGGVVRGLTGVVEDGVWVSTGVWRSSDASQPLTATALGDLIAGNLYVNIHTADYGGGEIRGQVLAGGAGFEAVLDRSQVVPSIPASAGTGTFTLSADRQSLDYDIRVEGIPAVTAAHFHRAAAGSSGGVVRALSGTVTDGIWVSTGTWNADDASQPLTQALVLDLLRGRLYINVHTADYGGGEIRGQVLR